MPYMNQSLIGTVNFRLNARNWKKSEKKSLKLYASWKKTMKNLKK